MPFRTMHHFSYDNKVWQLVPWYPLPCNYPGSKMVPEYLWKCGRDVYMPAVALQCNEGARQTQSRKEWRASSIYITLLSVRCQWWTFNSGWHGSIGALPPPTVVLVSSGTPPSVRFTLLALTSHHRCRSACWMTHLAATETGPRPFHHSHTFRSLAFLQFS